MLLKLNAINAAIRGQVSLNMRQTMHFERFLCFGDIYLEFVGILGIDISTGRIIHIWT